jgi:hypothetical protein
MIDVKEQYFNNLINVYETYGFNELTYYDKYHIILYILDKMTYGFTKYLGPFVQELQLPPFIHDKFPILGMNNENNYYVPKLYDLCMHKVKENHINTSNKCYNYLISSYKRSYTVDDYKHRIFKYFLDVYDNEPIFVIDFLINYYNYIDYTTTPRVLLTPQNSDSDSEDEIDYPEEEDESESEDYY